MPYSNGVISRNTSTTPNQGVSIYDVQRALKRGTSDLGLLCSEQEWKNGSLSRVYKINAWAKYKPVRLDKMGLLTDADRQDVYFGMYVPIYGSTATYGSMATASKATFVSNYISGWTHLPPRGKGNGESGADEWFRIRDFENYNANANSFYYPNGCTLPEEYIYGLTGQSGCTWSIALNTASSDLKGGIPVNEIKLGGSEGTAFSSLYFGLLFVSGNDYKIVTAETILSTNTGKSLTIDESGNSGLDGLSTGTTYTVYPILSVEPHSVVESLGNTSEDTIVALPAVPFQFSQIQESSQLILKTRKTTAVFPDDNPMLTVHCEVGMNGTGGTHSIGEVLYYIYTASSSSDTSGTLLNSGSVGPIRDDYGGQTPIWANIDYSARVTQPNYVRIRLTAYGHAGVEKTVYAKVTNGEIPIPTDLV